ncbi:WxcM domain protein [Solidesulfovibrio fructosivorans JJ]]|uniref:WxcM domain protein n=1 Tax=Solidesulfovibrio fructosivorans JJ] TaxID=596151 RepID=E1K294_SOLFR|nr:FdtA/QdtA family cupin domain-containing protein [Solidesulfovibrio fructosivorans]EFL49280.1 WxcM domain protein [Solidesulfovibrio fructosivorans JJ]]
MKSPLDGVRLLDVATLRDDRGALSVIEGGRHIPFAVARIFYMHGMTADRGGHAHRDTEQCILAVAGSLTMALTDGSHTADYRLDDPARALYLPPMIFLDIRDISPDAVCLVLASTPYDPAGVIRSLDVYRQTLAGT